MSRSPIKTAKRDAKNLVFSAVFHIAVGFALFFLAAREGVLGTRLKEITAFRVKEEKPPEPPKPEPPKVEPPKIEEKAEPAQAANPAPARVAPAPTVTAPPPVVVAPEAPPAMVQSDFQFDDGAKIVTTTADPLEAYRGFVEFTYRTRWSKPDGVDDTAFVAEVEVTLAKDGSVGGYTWVRGSNNKDWDDSVRKALAATRAISRPPPKGFPGKFRVRFDAIQDSEPIQ
jgi:hypothetical protein